MPQEKSGSSQPAIHPPRRPHSIQSKQFGTKVWYETAALMMREQLHSPSMSKLTNAHLYIRVAPCVAQFQVLLSSKRLSQPCSPAMICLELRKQHASRPTASTSRLPSTGASDCSISILQLSRHLCHDPHYANRAVVCIL